MVETRQNESLGGSAASGGGGGGGRDVHDGSSFDASNVISPFLQGKPLIGNDGRGKVWIGFGCSPSAGDAPFPTGVTATVSAAPEIETAAARFPVQSAPLG